MDPSRPGGSGSRGASECERATSADPDPHTFPLGISVHISPMPVGVDFSSRRKRGIDTRERLP